MLRLTELVEAICDRGIELEHLDHNPQVVVYWYLPDGTLEMREVELVAVDTYDRILLHCPLQPPP